MSFQNHFRRPRRVLRLLGRVLHTSSVRRGGRDSGPLRDPVSQTSQVALALLSRRCPLLLKGDLPWTTNSTSKQLSTPNVSFFMKICTAPLGSSQYPQRVTPASLPEWAQLCALSPRCSTCGALGFRREVAGNDSVTRWLVPWP